MPPHQIAVNPNLAQWLVQAVVRLFATSALVQGVAILIGGEARWRGPAFEVARGFPGAPESWGFILIALGCLTIIGSLKAHRRSTVGGLFLIGTWYFFFALTQGASLRNPEASPFGLIANITQAVLFILMGAAHKLEKR